MEIGLNNELEDEYITEVFLDRDEGKLLLVHF